MQDAMFAALAMRKESAPRAEILAALKEWDAR
jgi:hypothetical protein